MDGISAKNARLFCALILFFFVFLEATLFFQTRMSCLTGPGTTLAQLPIQGVSTVGLLAFPLLNRFLPEKFRTAFIAFATILGIVSLAGVAGGPTPYSIVAAGSVSFLLIGLAGGAVYWTCCVRSRDVAHPATFIGASHALAMMAQIPFFGLTPNGAGEVIVLSIGIVAMSSLIIGTWPPASAIEEMKAFRSTRADKRIEPHPAVGWRLDHLTANAAIALMIALVLLFALLFNTLYNLTFDEIVPWTSQYTDPAPRLMLAAGGLLGGILFDIQRARYIGVTMFWIALLAAAAVLGLQAGMDDYLGNAAYFFGSGAFMTFYTATFIWIAPHLKLPDFWCSMGRALNNVTAIAVGAPYMLVIQFSNPVAVTATTLPLLVGINVLLFATGMMDLRSGEEGGVASRQAAPGEVESAAANGSGATASNGAAAGVVGAAVAAAGGAAMANGYAVAGAGGCGAAGAEGDCAAATPAVAAVVDGCTPAAPAANLSPEERCAAFAERYGLTPRETEVLAAVTATDQPLKQIASDLGISLRVLQRHLTSLYSKTGTQTRLGLTKRFWD